MRAVPVANKNQKAVYKQTKQWFYLTVEYYVYSALGCMFCPLIWALLAVFIPGAALKVDFSILSRFGFLFPPHRNQIQYCDILYLWYSLPSDPLLPPSKTQTKHNPKKYKTKKHTCKTKWTKRRCKYCIRQQLTGQSGLKLTVPEFCSWWKWSSICLQSA